MDKTELKAIVDDLRVGLDRVVASDYEQYEHLLSLLADTRRRLLAGTGQLTEYDVWLAIPIEDLNFVVRIRNRLKRAHIHTVGDIADRTEVKLLLVLANSRDDVATVKAKLADYGLEPRKA